MEKKEQVKSSMKRVPADMDGHAIAADKTLSSTARARKMFQWLIAPMSVEKFYTDYYEKKPLLLKREQRLYFNGWFSKDGHDSKRRRVDRLLNDSALDAWTRLLRPSLFREARAKLLDAAKIHAMACFGDNIKSLLMQPPLVLQLLGCVMCVGETVLDSAH